MVNTRKRVYDQPESDFQEIKKSNMNHPKGWTQEHHYGMCGQSCPCCRARVEDFPLGVCEICWLKKVSQINKK